MNTERLMTMLKYLPCRAGAIPIAYRQMHLAEQEGLAVAVKQTDGTYIWNLTAKGKAFLAGELKPSKARRFK